jgi:hypothetical protein
VSNLDQTFSNGLLQASVGGSFTPPTTPITCRLMTANGTNTADGTELATSGGYVSGTGAPQVTFAAASGGSMASNIAVTVTNMPATTINGVELWDSEGSPKRLWWGALTAAKTTNSGDTFTIASGSLTLAMLGYLPNQS